MPLKSHVYTASHLLHTSEVKIQGRELGGGNPPTPSNARIFFDIFKLETQDKQDARKHFAKDWTAKLIGLIMVTFFCAYIGMITIMPPEQNSMELINLVLGYMGGLVSAVISFYFGASQNKE